jgi:phage-related protein
MPADDFVPANSPSISSGKTSKLRMLKAKFGDGYSQRAGDGLNTVQRMYNIVIEALTGSEADDIEEFFEDYTDGSSFLYTFPGEATQRKFTCEEWERKPSPGGVMFTISAKFEEVHDI